MTSTTFQIDIFFVADSVSLKCQPFVSKFETDSTDDAMGKSQLGTFVPLFAKVLLRWQIPTDTRAITGSMSENSTAFQTDVRFDTASVFLKCLPFILKSETDSTDVAMTGSQFGTFVPLFGKFCLGDNFQLSPELSPTP